MLRCSQLALPLERSVSLGDRLHVDGRLLSLELFRAGLRLGLALGLRRGVRRRRPRGVGNGSVALLEGSCVTLLARPALVLPSPALRGPFAYQAPPLALPENQS